MKKLIWIPVVLATVMIGHNAIAENENYENNGESVYQEEQQEQRDTQERQLQQHAKAKRDWHQNNLHGKHLDTEVQRLERIIHDAGINVNSSGYSLEEVASLTMTWKHKHLSNADLERARMIALRYYMAHETPSQADEEFLSRHNIILPHTL